METGLGKITKSHTAGPGELTRTTRPRANDKDFNPQPDRRQQIKEGCVNCNNPEKCLPRKCRAQGVS